MLPLKLRPKIDFCKFKSMRKSNLKMSKKKGKMSKKKGNTKSKLKDTQTY